MTVSAATITTQTVSRECHFILGGKKKVKSKETKKEKQKERNHFSLTREMKQNPWISWFSVEQRFLLCQFISQVLWQVLHNTPFSLYGHC